MHKNIFDNKIAAVFFFKDHSIDSHPSILGFSTELKTKWIKKSIFTDKKMFFKIQTGPLIITEKEKTDEITGWLTEAF